MQGGNECWEQTLWGGTLQIFEFSAPFCLGKTHHYFKQCDLFHSFHTIVKLHNVIVSAYAHYIDLWPMNSACLGHHAILMQSMLKFAMHYGRTNIDNAISLCSAEEEGFCHRCHCLLSISPPSSPTKKKILSQSR